MSYDAVGNRIRTIENGVTTNYTTNNLNQYTQVGGDVLVYDADGNLVSRSGPSGNATYTYDQQNRLVRVVTPSGVWEYQYDAFGSRIASTLNGQRTEFLLDPTGLVDVVGEYTSAGALVARYVHGLGLTTRQEGANSQRSFYDFDAIGSTAGMTDASGTVVNRYAYTPFGESLQRHLGLSQAEARIRALALLNRVHVTDAARRLDQYPHELSGGMRQRVMIAIALACDPAMLIADEPTTALDVTIQAQILALLAELKREQGTAMVLITHDLGVVAGIADRVVVMYGGRVVEAGGVRQVLKSPRHPYTEALLRSMPRVDEPADAPLLAIPGQPPNPRRLPPGCAFHPRCSRAGERCRAEAPPLVVDGASRYACHHPIDGGPPR